MNCLRCGQPLTYDHFCGPTWHWFMQEFGLLGMVLLLALLAALVGSGWVIATHLTVVR